MFRQIGQIALDGVEAGLLERMKRAVEGSAGDALTPRSTAGKGGDQPTEGGDQPVAFAQVGGGAAAQTDKKAGALAPASADREENVKQGQKSAVNLRVVSDNRRCLDTASRRRSKPHAPVVSRHLRLVWSEGHTILQRKITAQARMTKAPAPPSKTYT